MFIQESLKVIKNRQRLVIKRDEGWYSESEMKADLKWAPSATQSKTFHSVTAP